MQADIVVSVVSTAWQMTQEVIPQILNGGGRVEQKATEIRKVFAKNYRLLAEMTGIGVGSVTDQETADSQD